MPATFAFPPAALTWMLPATPGRVLVLGGAGFARTVRHAGHTVVGIDRSAQVAAQMPDDVVRAVAQAEALPFEPCQFDAVVAHQSFHRLAPGLVLSEFARVLKPGGTLALSWLVRDDSVPWVRRLLTLLHDLDPSAMSGDYGTASIDALEASKYFGPVEAHQYRHWVPITKRALLEQVAAVPGVRSADEEPRRRLNANVSSLYDSSAPGSDALRLPYQLRCWRAGVDHTELTAPITIADDGLVIRL